MVLDDLKNIYEDEWKKNNEINTSIKLPLTINIKSKEYKKLSPKMKEAVDNIFSIMDSKPSSFLNTFEKTIKDSARKFKVKEKDLLNYFEREMLGL